MFASIVGAELSWRRALLHVHFPILGKEEFLESGALSPLKAHRALCRLIKFPFRLLLFHRSSVLVACLLGIRAEKRFMK